MICRNINLYVTDIMRRDVVFVSYGSSYKELRDKLNTYPYSSFALVDSAGKSTITSTFVLLFHHF